MQWRRPNTHTNTYSKPDPKTHTDANSASFWRWLMQSSLECRHNVRRTGHEGEQERHQLPERLLDTG